MSDSLNNLTTKELRHIALDQGFAKARFMTRAGLLLRLQQGPIAAYEYAYLLPIALVGQILLLLVRTVLLPVELAQLLWSTLISVKSRLIQEIQANRMPESSSRVDGGRRAKPTVGPSEATSAGPDTENVGDSQGSVASSPSPTLVRRSKTKVIAYRRRVVTEIEEVEIEVENELIEGVLGGHS